MVSITVQPQGFTHMDSFKAEDSTDFIKSVLGDKFKMSPNHIQLSCNGTLMQDAAPLASYGQPAPGDPLQLEMQISYSGPAAQQQQQESEYKMPEIIEVNLGPAPGDDASPDQIVLVKVVRENLHRDKPFLGGFRHKLNGLSYHHAGSQTVRKRRVKGVEKVHREAQTVEEVTRSQQTNRETGTQMDRKDLYNDHSQDKVLLARKYFTADELQKLRDQKSKEIQCFLRQCFAWRRVRQLREVRYEKEFQEVQERDDQADKASAEHRRQIERRMHPRTKEDFAVLHKELDAWRLHETQRIKTSGLPTDELHFQLEELLGKEVKLLQTIDRLKITAARENKQSRTKETLEKMASPKHWASSEGDVVEVETPFTTRAKELVELYNGLCLTDLPKLQRVDVLLHVKYTVKEFDCTLTRDIVELIEREEDLLRRGRSEKSMDGLRRRLANLFLQFIDTPDFNPEAASYGTVPGAGT